MANRYGRDIDRDRERSGGEYGRRNFGRSSAYGSTPFADDEEYFGGGRQQYGEGYTGGSGRDYESYDRDYGRSDYSGRGRDSSDYSDRGYSGSSGESYQGGRYGRGSDSSRGGSGGRSSSGRFGGGDYSGGGYSGYAGGGSSGGSYSDRTSGYGNYGSTRYEERFGGQGSEDFGRYGSSYPSSERNYGRGYDESGDERGWWDKTSDEVASWFGDEEAARRRRMDARQSGGHRGRGPSGYSRSDDRIKEDINDRLTDYDYIDATNISVEVSGGDVTLTGTVGSRYEKRLAEDIAEDISGVKNVENRIRADTSSSSYSTGSQTTGSSTTGATGTDPSTTTQAKSKTSSSGT